MIGISRFINTVISDDSFIEFRGNKEIKFINYGTTQLVFVLTVNHKNRYTILVNQPATELGVGKTEFDNLTTLSNNNQSVIKPLYYFKDNISERRELYIAPYYYQARCIGVETNEWGIWVPEPKYHFKKFETADRHNINSTMIAILISLYDEISQRGICNCRLDGGDFMLKKDLKKMQPTMKIFLKT